MMKYVLVLCFCLGLGSVSGAPPIPPDVIPPKDAVVLLGWDASPDAKLVTGYKVYYGTSSGVYTGVVNAGTNLTCAVSNLTRGAWYYFAATAYTASGLESDYSVELAHQMVTSRADQVVRVVARVERSADFRAWAPTNVVLWEGTNPVGKMFWRLRGLGIERWNATSGPDE